MYAIVEIAGKQYKVRENDKLVVPRLGGEVDDTITFDRVLLIARDDEGVQLGTPVVPNASVTATIVEHVKGDKVLVFRKKRRKRYKVKRGHRQPYTRIEVSGLSVDGAATKAKKKAAGEKKKSAGDESEQAPKAETAAAKTKGNEAQAKTADEPKAKAASKSKKSSKAAKSEEPDAPGDEAAS